MSPSRAVEMEIVNLRRRDQLQRIQKENAAPTLVIDPA
jgi:hypothetical protein